MPVKTSGAFLPRGTVFAVQFSVIANRRMPHKSLGTVGKICQPEGPGFNPQPG